jgi:hypothetical protein
MNRFAYYALVVIFGLSAVGGAVLLAPSPAELGFYEHEMTCAEWFAREPVVTGSVRLTDCVLDASAGMNVRRSRSGTGVVAAGVRVRPPGVRGESERVLVLVTTDPDLRRLADTHERHAASGSGLFLDEGSPARFRERHRAELARLRGVEGVLEYQGWPGPMDDYDLVAELGHRGDSPADTGSHVLAPAQASAGSRAAGTTLLLLGLLGIGLLVRAQRRWTRRRAELTGNTTRPLKF